MSEELKIEDLEKIIFGLEKTLDRLEGRIETLEDRKPLRGEKGPPGDISMALYNVEKAAPGLVRNELKNILPEILSEVEQSIPALVDETIKRFQITTLRGERGDVGRDGARGEKGESGLTPTREMIEEMAESFVVKALCESQLLDETREYAGPIIKFAIEQEMLKYQK